MIDNIVEKNKPDFDKPVASTHSTSTVAVSAAPAAGLATEDYTLISRKLEYGFNNLRQEHADLRKLLEEVNGSIKMLRNDVDGLRMKLQQSSRGSEAAAPNHGPTRSESVNTPPTAMGAPQYRKTEADEAYESHSGQAAHAEEPQQARGFAKKEADTGIDINKVFYFGKK